MLARRMHGKTGDRIVWSDGTPEVKITCVSFLDGQQKKAMASLRAAVKGRKLVDLPDARGVETRREGKFRVMRQFVVGLPSEGGNRWINRVDCGYVEPAYLTPAQVATALQVDIQTVRKWLREGRLRGVRVGRLWRVSAAAVERGVRS